MISAVWFMFAGGIHVDVLVYVGKNDSPLLIDIYICIVILAFVN